MAKLSTTATNMTKLSAVASNMAKLRTTVTYMTKLSDVNTNMTTLSAVVTNMTQLIVVNTNKTKLSAVVTNMSMCHNVRRAVISAELDNPVLPRLLNGLVKNTEDIVSSSRSSYSVNDDASE